MDCSTLGLLVHHQLREITQTHVHQVGDAIQPSRPLPSPSPSAFNHSQHQGFFQWVDSQSIAASASASVFTMNIQGWLPLGLTSLIFFQSKGLSKVFSNTTVQKHQFFSTQLSSQSQLTHPYMTTGKTIALTRRTFVGKVMSLLFNMLSRLAMITLKFGKWVDWVSLERPGVWKEVHRFERNFEAWGAFKVTQAEFN